MKKLLGILVLGLLWCNVANAKDLTGTKLLCKLSQSKPNTSVAYDFISTNKVIRYYFSEWRINKFETSYKVKPDEIIIGLSRINRETLVLWWVDENKPCKILDKNVNLQDKMQGILDDLIKKQESKNKI